MIESHHGIDFRDTPDISHISDPVQFILDREAFANEYVCIALVVLIQDKCRLLLSLSASLFVRNILPKVPLLDILQGGKESIDSFQHLTPTSRSPTLILCYTCSMPGSIKQARLLPITPL